MPSRYHHCATTTLFLFILLLVPALPTRAQTAVFPAQRGDSQDLWAYDAVTGNVGLVYRDYDGASALFASTGPVGAIFEHAGAIHGFFNTTDGMAFASYDGQDLTVIDNTVDWNPSATTHYTPWNGKYYFGASAGPSAETDVFEYDPTLGSITNITASLYGAGDRGVLPTVYNDGSGEQLYFPGTTDSETVTTLYRYDGNAISVAPGFSSWSGPGWMASFDGYLYVAASPAGTDNDARMVRYDGSGVVQMLETNTNPNSGFSDDWTSYLTVFNGKLYFLSRQKGGPATSAPENQVMYSIDADGNVTEEFDPPNTTSNGPSLLFETGGNLYFRADDSQNSDSELWRFNSTGSATPLLGTTRLRFVHSPIPFDGGILFSQDRDASYGEELQFLDLSDNSVTRLSDINPGSENSFSNSSYDMLQSFSGQLAPFVDNAEHGMMIGVDAAPVDAAPAIEVWEVDNGLISSASVRIDTGFQAGDVLAATDMNGITSSFNAGTGVLTLSLPGTVTPAELQDVFRTVTYDPAGSGGQRTILFSATDPDGLTNNSTDTDAAYAVFDVIEGTTAIIDFAGQPAGLNAVGGDFVGSFTLSHATLGNVEFTVTDDGTGTPFESLTPSFVAADYGLAYATATEELLIGLAPDPYPSPGSMAFRSATPFNMVSFDAFDRDWWTFDRFTVTGYLAGSQVFEETIVGDADSKTTFTVSAANRGELVDEVRINGGFNNESVSGFTTYLDNILVRPGSSNASPVATAPSAPSVTEDGEPVALADDIQIADDEGDDQTVTFTITGGTLQVGATGITFGGDGNGSASFTASGTLAAVNTALDAATFTPAADVGGSNAGTIAFVSNDGTSNSNTATVTFDIAAVNDDPTASSVPSDATVTEDTASNVDLSAMTLTDVDAASGSVTLTLAAGAGTLTASSGGFVTVGGSGTGTLTLTGTVANINTFLDTASNVQYTGASNANGNNATTLTLTANDGGNTGSGGGGNVVLGTVNLDITAVNDAPTATGLPSDVTVTEDVASNVDLSAVTMSDVDGDAITATLTASAGTLSATSGGGVTVSGSGTGTLTLAGTAANINTYFDTASNIQYTGASNASGNDAATLTLDASDGTVNPVLGTVNIDITAVNDDPTATNTPTDITVTEDAERNLDLSAMTLADVDAAGSSITMTLAASAGTMKASSGGGVTVGGSETGTLTLSGTAANIDTFLDTPSQIRYTGPSNVHGNDAATVTLTANDGGNTGSGGGGDIVLGTVNVDITPVPDLPSVTDAETDEDVQTSSGLVVTRNESDGDEVTHFQLDILNGGTLFLSDGTTPVTVGDFITVAEGAAGLKFTPTEDRTTDGRVRFQASLSAAEEGTGGMRGLGIITINAVNDAPEVVKTIEFADPSMLEDGFEQFGALNGKLIVVQDVDAGSNDVEVTISAPSSTVTLASTDRVTFTTGDGTSDETMVFTGTVAEVNAVLTSGITYSPDPDEHGDLGFTITVNDGGYTGSGGAKTGSLTLDMPVSPVNDAPTFTKGADRALDEDAGAQSVAGWATSISPGAANESDQTLAFDVSNDNNALFAVQPAVSADGTLTFTPAANAFGEATVTVVLTDDGGDVGQNDDTSDPQTFTIAVNSINDPPVVTVPGAQTTLAGVPITFSDAIDNAITIDDVDLGKDVLDVTLTAGSTVQLGSTEWLNITGGADGTSMVSFSGSPADINAALDGLVYTPTPGRTTGSLTIVVSDGEGETTRQITVTITGVNNRPVAVDDAATTVEDTSVEIDVLANDSDENGDELEVVITTEPSLGTATVDADGIITYTPGANASGQDSFEYIARDPALDFGTATVVVTVTAVNDIPVALDDEAATTEGTSVAIDVLANDSDVESELTVTAVGDAEQGTVSINPDGSVQYTPAAGFSGSDSFDYTVSDGDDQASASVSIVVEATNDAPVATDDIAVVSHDGSVIIDVLENDTDPDGDFLTVSSIDSPSAGSLVDNGDGTITYTPDSGQEGEISFTYTISDPDGAADTATVTIAVAGASSDGDGVEDGVEDGAPNGGDGNDDGMNDSEQANVASLPVAAGPNTGKFMTVAAPAGTSLAGVRSTQNPSPSDFPGSAVNPAGFLDFRVTGLSAGASTTVWIHLPPGAFATGYLKYGPTADDPTPHWYDFGYDGETGALIIGNRILLFMKDGARGDDDLTENGVIVDPGLPVLGLNSAPVAADDQAVVAEDGSVNIDVLANDVDTDGGTLSVSILDAPASGSASVESDGSISYKPIADWSGEVQVAYRVMDSSGATSDAVAAVTVEPVQDAPVPGDDTAQTEEDQSVRIDIFANDVDADGDAFHLTSQDEPDHGTSVYQYDGSVTYTPDPDFAGTDSWRYTISDGPEHSGEIVFATITVTVAAVGDAPRFDGGDVVDLPSDAPVVIAESDGAFVVSVSEAIDPDGDQLMYEWHVALDEAFTDVLLVHDIESSGGGSSGDSNLELAPDAAELIGALEPAGLVRGAELTVFHRVRVTDDSDTASWSDVQQTTFTRSVVSTSTDRASETPEEFFLASNYPNPFNPATTVEFGLPKAAHVTLDVFDMTGKRVRTLVDGVRPAGTYRHQVRMDGLPSGIYIYRLVTPGRQMSRMMHLLK